MLDQPDAVEPSTCDPAACTAPDCPCRAPVTDSSVGKAAATLGAAPAAAIAPTLSGGHDHAGVYAPVDHNHDANYVPPSRRLDTAGSIVGGGDLSTHRSVTLVNDSAAPGPNMYYGTDGDGDKGWLPAGPTAVAAPVTSFFGRTGDVEPEVGDYSAAQVTSTPLTGVPATNVQDALTQLNNNKVPVSRLVGTAGSLIGGGKLDNHRTLQLAGDAASPGNNRYYGTNASGAKGFFPLPTGGGSGTPTSAPASSVTVTPSGSLAATDVQTALQELDSEKAPVAHTHTGAALTDKGDFYAKTRGGTLRETAGVIDVNIAGVAEKTTPTATDLVPIWDATAGAQRHVKVGNLPAGRAITPPKGEDVTIKLELPVAVDRRDFLLGFTATGAVTTTKVATVAQVDNLVTEGIKVVSTMSLLREKAPLFSDAIVWLTGYRAKYDGGEGFFYWDSTSTESDDKGTIIALNAGSTGRWKRWRDQSFYNVRWFDTPVSALAVANARAIAGYCCVLYFPGQAYSAYYDLGNSIIDTRVGLLGDGERSRITGNLTFNGGARNQTSPVRDVQIEGNVTLAACRSRLFENVQFTKTVIFPDDGHSYYNTFLHCQWMLVVGPAIQCGTLNNFNRIDNCRIFMPKTTTGPGILIGNSDGWVITGTSIEYEDGVTGRFHPFIDISGQSHTISGGWLEREYTSPFTDPGIVLRGNGINLQLGTIGHWMPISDLGSRNMITGAITRTSNDPNYRDWLKAQGSGNLSVVPNANGDISFEHRLLRTPMIAHLSIKGSTTKTAHFMSADETWINARITNFDGTPVTTGTYQLCWLAIV